MAFSLKHTILVLVLLLLVNMYAAQKSSFKLSYRGLYKTASLLNEDFSIINNISTDSLFIYSEQAIKEKKLKQLLSLLGYEILNRGEKNPELVAKIIEEVKKCKESEYRKFLYWLLRSIKISSLKSKTMLVKEIKQILKNQETVTLENKIAEIVILNNLYFDIKNKNCLSKNDEQGYYELLRSLIISDFENSEIKRAAIKGLQQLNYQEIIPDLLRIITDKKNINNSPLMKASCVALAFFKSKEALEPLGYILRNTNSESIFASASYALGELREEQSLVYLLENQSRFGDGYSTASIRKLCDLIWDILSTKDHPLQSYAVEATKYFYQDYKVNNKEKYLYKKSSYNFKEKLKNFVINTDDPKIIKKVLIRFKQILSKEEIERILKLIPYSEEYSKEFTDLQRKTYLVRREHEQSDLKTVILNSKNGKANKQEYGDPGYSENSLTWAGLDWLGHTGLYAGLDQNHEKKIIEVDSLFFVVKQNNWSSMEGNSAFWGSKTLNQQESLSFLERNAIINTAYNFIGADIGYPILPTSDALRHTSLDTYVAPNQVTDLRCDGLIEYCYEWNKLEVWGKNASNYDISLTANVEDHNDMYDWPYNPDEELAPIVQCGREGGSSTRMTSSSRTDLPAYSTAYAVNGSSANISIKATDRSGIHYIRYKIGSDGEWKTSEIQPQLPISDTYEFQFAENLAKSDTLFFFAMDNGGNYPETASFIYLEITPSQYLTITPANYVFPDQEVNTISTVKTFILENTGSDVVSGMVKLSGTNANQFGISFGGGFFSLAANETKDIGVQFNPHLAGQMFSLLTISSDEDEVTANLTGNGVLSSEVTELTNPDFFIRQNYPNPFNPVAVIEFSLPEKQNVKLEIFNSRGQVIKTLIDREMKAGGHVFNFDGSDFNSGIYFYRIISGEKIITKKMILAK